MRHCAWLNAAWDDGAKPDKKTRKSRRERFEADGVELEMPPCDAAYLVGYLFEIGPSLAAGMGAGPITHGEIFAWQRNTGIELDAWQARVLRQLSIEYCNESHDASQPDRPAPWAECPYAKVVQANQLKDSLRKLTKL